MTRASNNGREDGPWRIIPCKTGLAHTGSIVNDQSGNFVVTHFDLFIFGVAKY
jgi:hypothetical protein